MNLMMDTYLWCENLTEDQNNCVRETREENWAELIFAKTFGTFTRDGEKNWPIANKGGFSNDPRNTCGTHFGSNSLLLS